MRYTQLMFMSSVLCILSVSLVFQVTVMHNTTFMLLHMKTQKHSPDTPLDVQSMSDIYLDLPSLGTGQVTFGGQNPNSSVT